MPVYLVVLIMGVVSFVFDACNSVEGALDVLKHVGDVEAQIAASDPPPGSVGAYLLDAKVYQNQVLRQNAPTSPTASEGCGSTASTAIGDNSWSMYRMR